MLSNHLLSTDADPTGIPCRTPQAPVGAKEMASLLAVPVILSAFVAPYELGPARSLARPICGVSMRLTPLATSKEYLALAATSAESGFRALAPTLDTVGTTVKTYLLALTLRQKLILAAGVLVAAVAALVRAAGKGDRGKATQITESPPSSPVKPAKPAEPSGNVAGAFLDLGAALAGAAVDATAAAVSEIGATVAAASERSRASSEVEAVVEPVEEAVVEPVEEVVPEPVVAEAASKSMKAGEMREVIKELTLVVKSQQELLEKQKALNQLLTTELAKSQAELLSLREDGFGAPAEDALVEDIRRINQEKLKGLSKQLDKPSTGWLKGLGKKQ